MCLLNRKRKKMKEELRMEYVRLSRPDDLPTVIETHRIITDVGFSILYNHGKQGGLKDIWDEDNNLLYQMTIVKSLSLIQYSNPINYENAIDGTTIKDIYDPFSIYTIVRAQYEAFCNFNNIYIQSKSLDELQLKYYLWVLSGLNYRQRFKTESESVKDIQQAEAKNIDIYMNLLNSNLCFLQLENQSKTNVLK
jgi:hypothetical protein